MPTLTLDQILKVNDLKRETIEVPAWGGSVEIRELTAAEKLRIGAKVAGKDQAAMGADEVADLMIEAAAYGLGASRDQIAAVGSKSYEAIELVANKVLELSGMEKKAKAGPAVQE